MARSRRSRLMVFLTLALGIGAVAMAVSTKSSPSSDLICHTSNASECYPRIFEATKDFQTVHDDQELPAGLHVRMNVWTGEKEAKLNDASEDDASGALAGLAVERHSVDVVPEAATTDDTDKIPLNAPKYDPVGLVKEPVQGGGGGGGGVRGDNGDLDSDVFFNSVATIRNVAAGQAKPVLLQPALASLEDYAHDIYWGMRLMEDEAATGALLCMMSGKQVHPTTMKATSSTLSTAIAKQAASIVASALQNNPAALRKVEASWDMHMDRMCGEGAAQAAPLRKSIFGAYYEGKNSNNNNDDPAWIRSRTRAINQLVKSKAVMADFVAEQGADHVLQLLMEKQTALDPAREAAATLMLDNFLDADMGADRTLWPIITKQQGEEKASSSTTKNEPSPVQCDEDVFAGQCWPGHILRLAERHKKEPMHWSQDLVRAAGLEGQTVQDHSEL